MIPQDVKDVIAADPQAWRQPAMIEELRTLGDYRATAQSVSQLRADISFTEVFDALKPKNGQQFQIQAADEDTEDNPFSIIDVSAWQDNPAPEREWCLPQWIPKGVVTGLGGIGGASKSTLALQTCIHKALGWPMLGEDIEQGNAMFVSCEDDEDELHRRTQAIAQAMGVEISDFAERLHLIDRVGDDAILITPEYGRLARTPLYHQLDQMLGDLEIDLCCLDLLPDFWAGNENDRSQVNGLVKNHMAYLAKRHNLGLVTLYHPSKAGQQSGEGTSGSTAWEGSFRSRLYLEYNKDEARRTLKRMKANYAELQDVELVWRNGYLVEPSSLHASPEDELQAKWETDFLTALQHCDAREIEVSASPNSPNYYGKLFPAILKTIDGRRRWATPTQLQKAYYRAIATGTIYESERSKTSRPRLHFKGYSSAR